MSDWTGLAVIGFVFLIGLLALWRLSKPYDVTVEEFEKRAHEAPSLMSAGLVGLQKILDPATAKAVEAQEEFKQGRFDIEQPKGEGPDPGDVPPEDINVEATGIERERKSMAHAESREVPDD
jgi:hypothetical protein